VCVTRATPSETDTYTRLLFPIDNYLLSVEQLSITLARTSSLFTFTGIITSAYTTVNSVSVNRSFVKGTCSRTRRATFHNNAIEQCRIANKDSLVLHQSHHPRGKPSPVSNPHFTYAVDMGRPLTFGVELEFALACLPDEYAPLPHPEDVKKILRFTPTDDDWAHNEFGHSREVFLPKAISYAARRSVRETLQKAGFPVSGEKAELIDGDVSKWEVVWDQTIDSPRDTPYTWIDVEIRSPSLYFTSGSLKAVADVCILLNKTYGLHVDDSMGFHVHVGNSDEGFDVTTISNLIAFLWAFEPQLNNLHSQERQDQTWARSSRESSLYATEYLQKYGRRAQPLTGVIAFLKCQSIMELIKRASSTDAPREYSFKYSAYNFQGMADLERGDRNPRPTIEFRQHEGTMSAEAVTKWIETVVGIVDYIRNIDNGSMFNLLRIVVAETWEKLGDGRDTEREEKFGPILAESKFTIIDLLSTIRLHGPAKYYQSRWRKLAKETPKLITPKPDIEWEYESIAIPDSDEYKRLHHLRSIWDADRVAWDAQPHPPAPGGWKFDPDHPAWPSHYYITSNIEDSDDGASRARTSSIECLRDFALQGVRGEEFNKEPMPPPPLPSSPAASSTRQSIPARALNSVQEETLSDKEKEIAELDRQIAAFEPLEGASIEQEDKLCRERVAEGSHWGKKFFRGEGEIPKGSMNLFDDTQPRARRWRGRRTALDNVSPKNVLDEEISDDEMPFLIK
jgi:Putative amidoligase enzyme